MYAVYILIFTCTGGDFFSVIKIEKTIQINIHILTVMDKTCYALQNIFKYSIRKSVKFP